jgi:hypothetical protein
MAYTLKTMRAAVSAAALVIAIGASASAQAAALTGGMTLPNWSTTTIGGNGYASVIGDTVTLVSSNNRRNGTTNFSYLFSGAGALSFD